MASSEDMMRRVVTLITIALSSAPAMAETEADLNKAIKEMESTELGGRYKLDGAAYACPDKDKLMLIERLATGDTADQSTSQLIGGRDCESINEDATYTRCAAGGFVFPQDGSRRSFSGYCSVGATAPVLYVRDDLAIPTPR